MDTAEAARILGIAGGKARKGKRLSAAHRAAIARGMLDHYAARRALAAHGEVRP